ncbi:MAG: sigma-54 dependent transcriptional regulator [Pseudomonadota bacterium]
METEFARQPTLLVVDDDPSNLDSLRIVFERESYLVFCARGGHEALGHVRNGGVDVVLTDFMMPGMSGLELLKGIKALDPMVEVVLMTAYGTVERAVEAMRQGAYDFVTKPFKRIQIVKGVRRAMEKQALLQENRTLRQQLETLRDQPSQIIGSSAPFQRMMDLVRQVAPSEATVLIQGESGTGKELVAQEIHRLSPRSNRQLVPFNCAALPRELAESELFGHEKGAYSGAHKSRRGLFREADGGTLFLDEVSELDLATQGKLLRAIQEGEVKPVGGSRAEHVDVRIIAASKDVLREGVEAGWFREDLYYRLNVITVGIPPLRVRPEDVPLLAAYFVARFAAKNRKPMKGITPEALEILQGSAWPGNVRELENVIERAVVLTRTNLITTEELPAALVEAAGRPVASPLEIRLGTTLEEIEQRVLDATLEQVGGDKKLAADLLGISQRTVYRMLERRRPSVDKSTAED